MELRGGRAPLAWLSSYIEGRLRLPGSPSWAAKSSVRHQHPASASGQGLGRRHARWPNSFLAATFGADRGRGILGHRDAMVSCDAADHLRVGMPPMACACRYSRQMPFRSGRITGRHAHPRQPLRPGDAADLRPTGFPGALFRAGNSSRGEARALAFADAIAARMSSTRSSPPHAVSVRDGEPATNRGSRDSRMEVRLEIC
jgi:hypothetical protein